MPREDYALPVVVALRPQSSFRGVPKTAIQPVRQPGKTLLAGSGTNTWLLWALTATECAVPRGGG